MYQSLIWVSVPGDNASSLRTPLDTEDLECLANALVDSVRRNVELGRDFLGAQVLIDEEQAIELTLTQAAKAFRHQLRRRRINPVLRHATRPLPTMRCDSHPAQPAVLPSRVHAIAYGIS
jgi:hypothetical protein